MFYIDSYSLVILLTALLIALVCHFIIYRIYRLPPGPWGYPFVGLYCYLSEKPHLQFNQLAQKYGDVFCFTLFGKLNLNLNSLEVIKEAFSMKGDVFNGRETEFSLVNFWDDGEGISQTEGEIWKMDRRFFLQNVKKFGFGSTELEPHIHNVATVLLKTLQETNGQPLKAILPICLATVNVAGKVFYSVEYDSLDDPEFIYLTKNAYSIMEDFVGPRMLLSGYLYKYFLFRWLSPNYHKIVMAKKAFYDVANKIIKDHEKSFDKNNIRDFTDRMLEEMRDQKSKGGKCSNPITYEKIRGLVVNIFVDGMLSTTNTLNGFLQMLALNEDVQHEIQKEVDSVIGNNRLPSWVDRKDLKYTEAALLELHRTTTPFPLSVAHRCTETTEFRGYMIPKGTLMLSNLWAVHNDPKIWKNSDKCDPTRFLSIDNKHKYKQSIVSFGVGKRFCVGEPLATMEIFIFVVSILQKFNIRLPPQAKKENEMKNEFEICFIPRGEMDFKLN